MKTPHIMTTLSQAMNVVKEEGFKENFEVRDKKLYAPGNQKSYEPDDVSVKNFYRFEGNSDPGDSSILYAIEAKDGTKGILTDAYGIYSDGKTSEFMKRVEEIEKREAEKTKK